MFLENPLGKKIVDQSFHKKKPGPSRVKGDSWEHASGEEPKLECNVEKKRGGAHLGARKAKNPHELFTAGNLKKKKQAKRDTLLN